MRHARHHPPERRLSPAAEPHLRPARHAVRAGRVSTGAGAQLRHRRLPALHPRRPARRKGVCRGAGPRGRDHRQRHGQRRGHRRPRGRADRLRPNPGPAGLRRGRDLSPGERGAVPPHPGRWRRGGVRVPAGHQAPARPLSRPQPHHQWPQPGRAAGGGRREVRRDDHRQRRAGSEPGRVRRARLDLLPAERRAEPADRGGRDSRDLRLGHPGALPLGRARGRLKERAQAEAGAGSGGRSDRSAPAGAGAVL